MQKSHVELPGEEFRGIIRSVLAPEMRGVMGGVEYMRPLGLFGGLGFRV